MLIAIVQTCHSGDVKALASVSGPIEVRLAAEHASKATLEVSVRPLYGTAGEPYMHPIGLLECVCIVGTESKELASAIHAILSPVILFAQNPRTLTQLTIQALSPHGSHRLQQSSWRQEYSPALKAACVNASMAALLDAGGSVPLKGMVCAVSTVAEPDADDGACMAFFFGGSDDEELVWTDHRSWLTERKHPALADVIQRAREDARHVRDVLKESISKKHGE
jgi:exosome complex component RRP46